MKFKRIEKFKVSDLKENPKNPKLHTAKQITGIMNSIKSEGFNVPVKVDQNGVLIAGHGRRLACLELGIKEVPAYQYEDISEEIRDRMMLVDNHLSEITGNDETKKMALIEELINSGEDLSLYAVELDSEKISSFSNKEIDKSALRIDLKITFNFDDEKEFERANKALNKLEGERSDILLRLLNA